MITRDLQSPLLARLFKGKAILLLGPRQSGKTTLMRRLEQEYDGKSIWMNCDNLPDREMLNGISSTRAPALFPPGTLLLLDEAQRLENTGLSLKIIIDSCPGIQMIASGSSAFELSDKIREPLTGRKVTMVLYPISLGELSSHTDVAEVNRTLETRLIFGSYPEVVNEAGSEAEVLAELASDYLYKDVFLMHDIRKPDILEKLLRALAYQIGQQVSYRELAGLLQVDKETVEKYIRMLEEAYVIFRLPSYASNLRNELKKSQKIYFVDNGVRNAVINQFNPLSLRNDAGMLWENLMMAERRKWNHYQGRRVNAYFWRTSRQQEVDYLEGASGQLEAFEFKWRDASGQKFNSVFSQAYPEAGKRFIHKNNFWSFLSAAEQG